MAAFTSKATGNWGSAGTTTWNEVGVPGDGDTVTIATGHVITIAAGTSAIVGGSGATGTAAITIVGTGKLIIDTGATLVCRGDILLGATSTTRTSGFYQLTLNAGAILELDASAALTPLSQTYVIGPTQNNSPNSRVQINGTALSRCTVRSNVLGGNGRFSLRGFNTRVGSLTATYTDFTRIGDSSNKGFDLYLTSATVEADTFSLSNCTMDACGQVGTSTVLAAAAVFSCISVIWTNTPGVCTAVSSTDQPSTGTRLFRYCSFDKTFQSGVNSSGFTVDTCVIYGSLSISEHASQKVASFQDCLFRKSAAGTGVNQVGGAPGAPGDMTRCYYLTDNPTSTNNKWWKNPVGYGITMDGGHWESLSTLDNTGDFWSISATPGAVYIYTIKHFTVSFSPTTTERPGTRISIANASSNIRVVDEHNTWIAGGEPAFSFSETAASAAGTVTSFKSNITYATNVGGTWQFHVHDIVFGGTPTTDVLDGNAILNNAGFGLAAGTAGRGFAATLTVAPGATNITGIDPNFVDTTRTLAKWNASLGGAETTAAALTRLLADPTLVPSAYTWVRAGWAPRAPQYQNMGHDGVDIGAVPYNPLPNAGGAFGYTAPGRISRAKTVTKSDTTADPAGPFGGIWVDVAGDVKLTLNNGDTAVFANVQVGPFYAKVSRVWTTGTTATVTVAF